MSVLLSDNFESGTFAAWDTVNGSCSIVTDPLGGGSHVAKFDCAAADAYLAKTLAALAPYSAAFDLLVPAATITALQAASAFFSPIFLENQADGFFLGDGTIPIASSPPMWTQDSPGAATGAFTTDTWHRVELVDDGTDFTWSLDGATVFHYSNFGLTPGPEWDFGGLFANHVAGEIYYIDNVLVEAITGTTVVGIFDGGAAFKVEA